MLRNFSRLVIVLGAALLAGAPALHAQSGTPVRGDVDGDGKVTAADARIVSDFLVGKPVPPGANVRERGDVNGDGRVTSVDAAIIARAAAGRDVSRFPVGTPAVDIPGLLARVSCDADLRAGTVRCGDQGLPAGPDGPRALRLGDTTYVKLVSSDLVITKTPGAPGDTTVVFNVAVTNKIPQSLGTTDNVNPDVDSVRVFFISPPIPNGVGNSGTIDIVGPTGTFTTSGQHYYQYPGFLTPVSTPGASGPKREFRFVVHGLVTTFRFYLGVAAAVQYPAGWVDIYRPDIAKHPPSPYLTYADTLLVNEVDSLRSIVRNAVGDSVPASPPVGWGSNNAPVATVGSGTGVVTANTVGTALLTATSGARSGTFNIVVTTTSTDSTTITPANASRTVGDSTLVTVQVRDQFGRNVGVGSPYVPAITLTTDRGTLRGTAAAGTTVTPVDSLNGKYTAWLKSDSAGTATVTGTLDGVAIVDNATVTFNAGAMTHFRVEAAAGGNIPDQLAGTPFNVKVTARDQHDNIATTFTGTVNFTTTPSGGITAGAGPSAAFVGGVLASHAITIGTTGDYTLTATVTGGGGEAGTSNSFQVQSAPAAVADAPTPTSVPGDPYHGAFNSAFTAATLGVLSNDTRGFPLATVTAFGGGDLGGSVTDHAFGTTVSPLPGHADGSLTVNADGSIAFTPYTGFTGLYTFQYRIGNPRGTSDAQVTIAVGVRPTANNDSYPTNLLGNVPINTATSSNFKVITNDAGDAKVLALGTATNGTAQLNADGTFTFTPNAGYTGPASFTYTVTNGFGTVGPATVSMTVSGIAWFVDKGAAAGDGRLGTPFNDLSAAFAAGTKPLANQPIFLYSNASSYTGGVTLLAGQRLVGQGATGASFAAVMGVTWPADAGTQPSIGGTAPTVANGLTLGSGNTLQGFNSSGTITGNGFGTLTVSEVGINNPGGQALSLTTGTLAGGFSTLISGGGTNNVLLSGVSTSGTSTLGASGNALSGASKNGVAITGGSGSFTFPGNVSNATVDSFAVNVSGKTGGTVTFSGSINPGGAARGISVTGNNSGSNTIVFSGGTKAISSAAAAGVILTNNAGATIQFSNGGLAIATTTGTPFTATGGGTVEVTGAANTISATGNAANAVLLNGITLGANGMSFASIGSSGTTTGSTFSATSVGNTSGSSFTATTLTVAGSSTRGIDLSSNSAPFSFNGGSVASTGTEPLFVNGGSADITVAASLTKTSAGRVANIGGHTAGTVTVSGALSCTSSCTGLLANGNTGGTLAFTSGTQTFTTATNAAISLTSNTGATINFTGGALTISTTSGAGFTATGGGTVNVTGANNTIGSTALVAGGGNALNVQNTTIGSSNLVFKSINATGGTYGIRLENTGSSGGLQVTGTGSTANSGGILTLNNVTAADSAALTFTGTANLSLKLMKVSLLVGGASGIIGSNLSGTSLIDRSVIDYNSSAPGALHGAFALRVANSSTNGTLTVDGTTFQNGLDGEVALSISAMGTSVMTFNLQDSNTGDSFDSKFTNIFSGAVVVGCGDDAGSTASCHANVTNTKFLNAPSNGINNLGMGTAANGTLVANISNNTFDKVGLPLATVGVININTSESGRLGGASEFSQISNNSITNIRSGAGPTFAYDGAAGVNGYVGIRVAIDGNAGVNHKLKIMNNTITNLARQGIIVSARGSVNDANVLIQGNTVGTAAAPVAASNRRAVEVETQSSASLKILIQNNPSIVGAGSSGANSSLAVRAGVTNSSTGTLFATVLSNTIGSTNAGNLGRFRGETAAGTTGSSPTLCLDLRNNVLESASKVFELTNNVGTFNRLTSGNTGTITETGSFGSVASCTQPSF